VPADVQGIPALIAKTADLNAKVEVSRATSLNGSIDQRTLKFTVTAEDDTSFSYYTIEFVKQKSPDDIQPFFAEPIISQFVFWIGWGATNLWEIANPGNQPLDLSNYMIVGGPLYNPADAITVASETDDWADRYRRYIPGYKWVNDADWAASPSMVELDLNVSPIVFPGDVFVLGSLNSWAGVTTLNNIDIDFANNPWGEPVGATCASNWSDQNFFIFKILNDSIKRGLKPATDVNDFELIETFGTGDGSTPYGWFDFNATVTRKPEFYEGKTGFKESFGEGWWHTSEWDYKDAKYWAGQNVYDYLAGTWDIGKHYMYEPTNYKSTVSSAVYKVSEGYGLKESIRGPINPTVCVLQSLKQKGYQLYGLTNFSLEKFQLVSERYPFINIFEDILVSGAVKLAKPDPRIFQLMLERISRPARECVFIDDSAVNVSAARDLGFHAIHFQSARQMLVDLDAIIIACN